MPAFDPSAFMGQVYEEAGQTTYKPIPEGDYQASLSGDEKDFKIRPIKTGSVVLDVWWILEDSALAEQMNTEQVRARQGFFLDLDANGRLLWGTNQNVALARLREALGQNEPGKAWSAGMLRGAGPAIITIKQRPDPDDPNKIYSEVVEVNPMKSRRRSAA